MKRQLGLLISTLAVVVLLISAVWPGVGHAFDSSNLMDDSVFDNTTSMTAAQIDSWLNSNFPSSCISTNNGFDAADPTGYTPSAGFTYGNPVSAGTVIYDAAAAYSLNPQVLLATMQKEQSLVSGSAGCSVNTIAKALGYGCPDSGGSYSYTYTNGTDSGTLPTPIYYSHGSPINSTTGTICVNSALKAGFSEQVIHAAWLLKFSEERSEGKTSFDVDIANYPQPGDNWNNSDDPQTCYEGPMTQGLYKRCSTDANPVSYDGYDTIDGVSTYIATGATAALYWYTPHFSGNQNFDNIFAAWFGTLYGNTIGTYADRLYDPTTHHHYFTAIENNRESAKSKGYNDDVIDVFNVGSTQLAGMVPIYALYNGKLNDNWLLPDGNNLYWAVNFGGYGMQGVAFYAYPANPSGNPICPSGSVPVYQMWNGGLTEHFYSIHGVDRWWALIYGGYVDDGSSTYLDPNNGDVSFCVPQ